MGGISYLKIVGILAALAAVGGILFTLRHELIEKGMNLVYAQDNAAIVKAQADQSKRDAETVDRQRKYIERLELSGVKIVEQVRNVPGPCKNDGRDDPRLNAVSDWLRDALSRSPGSAEGGPATQGTVSPAELAAPRGTTKLR